MEYHFGSTGFRQMIMSSLLLVLWASALVLIVDIHRPRQGTVAISRGPIAWALESLGPRR
jgi:hypothetical protein